MNAAIGEGLIVSHAELATALLDLQRIVTRKSGLEVERHVLVEHLGGYSTLTAHDWTTTATVRVASSAKAGGRFLVHLDTVRGLLSLTGKGRTAAAKRGPVALAEGAFADLDGEVHELSTFPLDDHPPAPPHANVMWTGSAPHVRPAIERATLAAGSDPTLPTLMVTRLWIEDEPESDTLVALGHDRFRICEQRAEGDWAGEARFEGPVAFPADVLRRALPRLAKAGELRLGADLDVDPVSARVTIGDGRLTVSTRPYDGELTRTAGLWTGPGATATLDRARLRSTIEQLLAGESKPLPYVRLSVEDAALVVSLRDRVDHGTRIGGSRTLPAVVDLKGGSADWTMIFDPAFLADALVASGHEEVVIAQGPRRAQEQPRGFGSGPGWRLVPRPVLVVDPDELGRDQPRRRHCLCVVNVPEVCEFVEAGSDRARSLGLSLGGAS